MNNCIKEFDEYEAIRLVRQTNLTRLQKELIVAYIVGNYCKNKVRETKKSD